MISGTEAAHCVKGMRYEFAARDSTGDLTVIVPHSREIGAVLRGRYDVGVYGSGLVCSSLRNENLVAHTWLSMSMSYEGSRTFHDWNMRQLAAIELPSCNLSVDTDIAIPPFGAFHVS